MLTDASLRSSIDALWNKLYAGGLSNPLDAIEQISFLLFLKRLDEREIDAEKIARLRQQPFTPLFPDPKLRWSHWTKLEAKAALAHVRDHVFPFLKTLASPESGTGVPPVSQEASPLLKPSNPTASAQADGRDAHATAEKTGFARHMEGAEFKINKPALLIEACATIDAMDISGRHQDVQGDVYEYLLSRLNQAGRNGQFRTPRHIIRLMVQMINPQPGERICDPAAGTGGFLVNAYQHILEKHTPATHLKYDEEGYPHGLTGELLSQEKLQFLQTDAITGYDSDSGMTMLRIGAMNLMLHGLTQPNFHWADSLAKEFTEAGKYEVIIANPPFKGAVSDGVHPDLPQTVKKSEILFLHLFLRLLDNGGRAAVIVPDGVLFGSSKAHVGIRKRLVEEHRLEGVVSMPSGVFRPYAGVSTAILFFTKASSTTDIWFYDMEHDGFSLDDKRQPVPETDLPDLLTCWQNRYLPKFQKDRATRLATVQAKLSPLRTERLALHAQLNQLRFDEVLEESTSNGTATTARTARETAETTLADLEKRLAPFANEAAQLSRQFSVKKATVVAQNYDLSASRYRPSDPTETYYDPPAVTLDRLQKLGKVAEKEIALLLKEVLG